MGLFDRRKDQPRSDAAGGSEASSNPGSTNARVREALTTWAQRKDSQVFADVMRRAVVGQLLLDITESTIADPNAAFQPGDVIAVTSQRDNAGKHLLAAFTGNDELARYRGQPGRSLVQPAAAVLAQAARDYDGIVIDGRSPGVFIAYGEEIRQQLADDPEAVGRLTEATATRALPFRDYLDALSKAPVFIPFETRCDESGNETGVVVPAVTGQDGKAYAVAGTAPAELWAWRPSFGAQRTALANVARAVLEDNQAGLVVNPAGPSVTIPVDVLRPFATL